MIPNTGRPSLTLSRFSMTGVNDRKWGAGSSGGESQTEANSWGDLLLLRNVNVTLKATQRKEGLELTGDVSSPRQLGGGELALGPRDGQWTGWEVTREHQTREGLGGKSWGMEKRYSKRVRMPPDPESGGCGRILAWQTGQMVTQVTKAEPGDAAGSSGGGDELWAGLEESDVHMENSRGGSQNSAIWAWDTSVNVIWMQVLWALIKHWSLKLFPYFTTVKPTEGILFSKGSWKWEVVSL